MKYIESPAGVNFSDDIVTNFPSKLFSLIREKSKNVTLNRVISIVEPLIRSIEAELSDAIIN